MEIQIKFSSKPRRKIILNNILALYFAILLNGCSSTLQNLTPINKTHFQVGLTPKREVANVLGLPISSSKKDEHEFWIYSDAPGLSSLVLPSFVGGISTPVIVSLSSFEINEKQKSSMIFCFNRNGILESITDLRGKK